MISREEYTGREYTLKRLTRLQEDILTDVLQSLRLHSALYCRALLRAPWGVSISRRTVASFHLVIGGAGWLTVEGVDTAVSLTEGDLVILPHGHAHTLTDQPGTPATNIEDFEDFEPVEASTTRGAVSSGGRGAVTTLVCGRFTFENLSTHPLSSMLPAWLHLRSRGARSAPLLRTIVRLVQTEARESRLAADMVITRLSEILFIEAVRAHLTSASDGDVGWLGALKDPQIGQAMALIQRHAEEPWTVEALADRVGLSRSAFSAKFSQLVGEPPMRYVGRVRLTRAAILLRTQAAPLREVAAAVGYDSDVTLSKAFKRQYGLAPGVYRRADRSSGD